MQKSYFCMEQKYEIMKGSKGSETKMTIREEAFRLFLTKDFNIVPLKQIERSLNLSRGCMSYHYPTKQELFNDVIDYYILHKQNANNKMQGAFNLWNLFTSMWIKSPVAKTKCNNSLAMMTLIT